MMSTLKDKNETREEDASLSSFSGMTPMGVDSQDLMEDVEKKATLREMQELRASIQELREMNKILM